jgi:hypothetical protein
VAAVVEVKSTLPSQWNQVLETLAKLQPLRRSFGAGLIMGGQGPAETIPLFVASYTGWKTREVVQDHVANTPGVAGILIIDEAIFVSSPDYFSRAVMATGSRALWGLICCLHEVTSSLQAASTSPIDYAL